MPRSKTKPAKLRMAHASDALEDYLAVCERLACRINESLGIIVTRIKM